MKSEHNSICIAEYIIFEGNQNTIHFALGAIYLGRPENWEGGGWFVKNRTSGKIQSPKNKDRNYSIMSNFTTVCTYYINNNISVRYSPAVCYYGTVLS